MHWSIHFRLVMVVTRSRLQYIIYLAFHQLLKLSIHFCLATFYNYFKLSLLSLGSAYIWIIADSNISLETKLVITLLIYRCYLSCIAHITKLLSTDSLIFTEKNLKQITLKSLRPS